jgi:hypothetical protein
MVEAEISSIWCIWPKARSLVSDGMLRSSLALCLLIHEE